MPLRALLVAPCCSQAEIIQPDNPDPQYRVINVKVNDTLNRFFYVGVGAPEDLVLKASPGVA